MEKRESLWVNRNIIQKIILIIAVGATAYHLWYSISGTPEPIWFRAVHLSFLLPLVFLLYPMKNKKMFFLDIIWFISSFISLFYLWGLEYDRILTRYVNMDPVLNLDMIMGSILIISLIEGARRILGLPLTILTIISVIYLFFGDKFPSVLSTNSFSYDRIIEQLYLTSNGIFGVPLGASASFIFLFIFFGSLLQRSGAGKMFIDLVKSMVGHYKGGPAKISVLASAFMGTLSGSPTANVVTTGAITIPMMEKSGYKKNYAAAVEAASSTGGQLMPPVMGAVAFVLANFVGIPYAEVMIAAILPAILFYLAVMVMVHLFAAKNNLGGLDKSALPSWVPIIKLNWHQLIPIFILVYFLISGYTAYYAATFAIFSIPIINLLRKHTRMGFKKIILAMEDTLKASILVALATAAAGIIIGSISLSGVAVNITGLITSLSQTTIFLSLILTMIATIILGMGMPTTAAYITSVAITAPPLVAMGIDVFSAHMFVLYFACLSSITPPVAIAAYAAAGMNGANALKTAFLACKIGLIAFIVPYIFIFSDALFLQGSFIEVAVAVVTAVLGVILIGCGLEGYMFKLIKSKLLRLCLVILGIVALYPNILMSSIAVLFSSIIILFLYFNRKKIQPSQVYDVSSH